MLESQQNDTRSRRPPPLQFRLRSMLLAMTALGVLFAALRSLGVPAHASVIVLAVLAVSVPAALVLVVVIARSLAAEDEKTAASDAEPGRIAPAVGPPHKPGPRKEG